MPRSFGSAESLRKFRFGLALLLKTKGLQQGAKRDDAMANPFPQKASRNKPTRYIWSWSGELWWVKKNTPGLSSLASKQKGMDNSRLCRTWKTISDTVPISPVQLLWTFYIRERLDYPKAGMTKAGRFEVDWVTRVPRLHQLVLPSSIIQ